MSFKGKRNSYCCTECGGIVITIDQDEGVTPFMIGCNATDGCSGMMESALYRNVPDIVPHFIWRKVSKREYRKASRAMQEHLDKGGLEIFPAPTRSARQ